MYGIRKIDLLIAQSKLDEQRNYLKNQTFINSLGECRNFLDISMSANFSPKYYAEIANRVNVLNSFAIDYDQSPVFLTITLNGCFRSALNGDFSKFKAIDRKYLTDEAKYKLNNNIPFCIRDLISILNYQWNLFIMRFNSKFKKIERSYIRCFEPHKKDGVPHIHALFYVPKYTINYMLKIYKDLFNAPQNLKTNAISKEQAKNGEINGFQTTINNPSGYVMKYIQKTFINLNETDNLNELSAWYVKYKVRRFISSRTKVPLWVYRKINFISSMQDFYHLNDFKNDENSILEWDYLSQYIYIFLPSRNEKIIYDDGKLEHFICDKLINSYDKLKPKYSQTSYNMTFKNISKKFNEKQILKYADKLFNNYNECKKSISRMSDFELVNYYMNLDYENTNLHHLAFLENTLFERNLGNFTHIDKKHDLNNLNAFDFIKRGLNVNPF